MNSLLFIKMTVAVVLFLCIGVFIYFQVYKKNINKALNDKTGKPKHMIEPYKVLFVLVVFLVSFAISLTSIAGLIYSKNYFKYEKDTAENMASRIVYVDYSFEKDNLHRVNSEDTERINQIILQKYHNRNINVIPVYTFHSGVYLYGNYVNLYAIPKEYASSLGLGKMKENVAYFYNEEIRQAEFEICVTKIVDNGFISDKLENLTFEAESGGSENALASVIEKQNMTPSMKEYPICFVTMDSFYKMASIMVEDEIKNEADLDKYNELISLEGIYIFSNSLSYVNSISSTLVQNNYNAQSSIDAFEDFEEAISNIFLVFVLSSAGLVLLSTVNIYITVRTVKRIKNKDD